MTHGRALPCPTPKQNTPPKKTMPAGRKTQKGAVIHSHGMECVLATLLAGETATEFRITHQEMIKGIAGACVM